MVQLLSISLLLYIVVILAITFVTASKLDTEEDFLVGGRKFNLWLTTFCLFATWFGAGTLLTATDEVAAEGLSVSALEPYGAGLCLIIAGFFIAKPLWEMKLLTYADFYRQKFGRKAEFLVVVFNIPSFVGWIAVQIVALSNILAVFYPVPVWVFIIAITAITCIITLSGGMLSVSITDAIQLGVIVIGLTYLVYQICGGSYHGLIELIGGIPEEKKVLIPTETLSSAFSWLGLLCISALGNLTGQDLGQRIFSAESSKTAQHGCIFAGIGYILIGSIPVFLGLTASATVGQTEGSILPGLISSFLDPISGTILMIAIVASVISTLTSALLAPSSLLACNLFSKLTDRFNLLFLCRVAVLLVAVVSAITALLGEDIYGILEASYSVGFVGLFTPLVIGLYSSRLNETACLISMSIGILVWLPEFFGYENLPYSIIAVFSAFICYFICYAAFTTKTPE